MVEDSHILDGDEGLSVVHDSDSVSAVSSGSGPLLLGGVVSIELSVSSDNHDGVTVGSDVDGRSWSLVPFSSDQFVNLILGIEHPGTLGSGSDSLTTLWSCNLVPFFTVKSVRLAVSSHVPQGALV